MKTATNRLLTNRNGNGEDAPLRSRGAARKVVEIPAIKVEVMRLKIVGDSQLVTHAWDSKTIKMMLDKQMGKAKQAREKKSPEDDYAGSMYRTADGKPGIPASAFKSAAVDACSHVQDISKVVARGVLFVMGDILPIIGKPRMHESTVRVGRAKTADIRYRASFDPWAVNIAVRYNANMLTPDQIANLFNVAGFAIGVGEYRPQRNGSWGMFHVE